MLWKYYNKVRLDGATPRAIMQHVPLSNWILKHQSSCPVQTINWIYVEALFLTDEILEMKSVSRLPYMAKLLYVLEMEQAESYVCRKQGLCPVI